MTADFLALEAPEGYRAELVAGEIVLSPPQDGDHEAMIGRVLQQVLRAEPEFDYGPHKGLVVPGGRYIPDGTFTEYGAMRGQPGWWEPSGVVLVMEVTSRLPVREHELKRPGYALAGIPLYLVLDRGERTAVLYGRPVRGDYTLTTTARAGAPLPLPAPFGFELDTADLFA
nr:Uma2 family endonuclease [Kitasatospora sp. SID7827]